MRIFYIKYLVNTHLRIIFAACLIIERSPKIRNLVENVV